MKQMKTFTRSIMKTIMGCCLCFLFSTPLTGFAQDDINPCYSHHDDDHYIRAHDNNKYYQEFINYNGKVYMYYNRTYNHKSKDMYFYEVQFNSEGKITDKIKLAHGDKDYSDDLYFEKDNTMNSAFFGVDNYLFVVVQNKKHEKNRMYRLNLTNNDLDIVDLDNDGIYQRYYAAVCSGYDVILFTNTGTQSFTFSKTENNLVHKANNYDFWNNENYMVTSAVAVNNPDEDKMYAYAAFKNIPSHSYYICRYDFEDIQSYHVFTTSHYKCTEMELISGRSMSLDQSGSENTDGSVYLSVFSTDYDKYKDDKHEKYYKRIPINYGEVKIDGNNIDVDFLKARIVLPSDDYYAKSSDDALIDIVENYVPVDASTYMQGNDGFQKQNILVSCDKKNETNFSVFPSDYYEIYEEDTPVQSNMAEYTDEEWKQTWTLIGIFDGAPPCAVDWEEWELLHEEAGTEIAPTELVWGLESEGSNATSIKTKNSWSLGLKGKDRIPIGEVLKLDISAKAKYAQTNETVNELSNTIITKLTIPMPLTEENQEEAVWYYMVPTIERFTYATFDWSDTELQHPIDGVTDYAFMTTGYTLQPETVPIGTAPHYVSEPNEELMTDWTARANTANDTTIGWYAFHNGLSSNNYVSYNSTYGGTSSELISQTEQSTEQSNTKTWAFSLSAGIAIPHVFDFGITGTYSYKHTTTSTVTTTFTQSVELSLSNLKPSGASAIYPESYTVHPYLFTPEDNEDWWFFDNPDLMDFKPWYLAYTVTTGIDKPEDMLSLSKPANNEAFYVDEPIGFAWSNTLKNTKLVVSNEPSNKLKSIVYHGELNDKSACEISNLPAGTYYWRVAGISEEGYPVWSEFRQLTVVEKDFLGKENALPQEKPSFVLPAKIYPNPAYTQQVSVTYEVKDETSPVKFILYSLSGLKLWEQTYSPEEAGIHNKAISMENLKTNFGILKILNGNYTTTQKIAMYPGAY